MLKFLKTILNGSEEKVTAATTADNESTETKKCLNCLRRVNIEHIKCPYCKKDDFQY